MRFHLASEPRFAELAGSYCQLFDDSLRRTPGLDRVWWRLDPSHPGLSSNHRLRVKLLLLAEMVIAGLP